MNEICYEFLKALPISSKTVAFVSFDIISLHPILEVEHVRLEQCRPLARMRLPEPDGAGILEVVIVEVSEGVPRHERVPVVQLEAEVLHPVGAPGVRGGPVPHHLRPVPELDCVGLPEVGRLADEDGVQDVAVVFEGEAELRVG